MEETPTQAYGEVEYWNNRYGRERHPFDWYQKYPSLAPLLNLYLPLRHLRVLVVGCGNSAFSEGMIDDGYEEVVNIDISKVVIQDMKAKYADRPQLKYIEMDARKMDDFQSGSYDAVVDKGTLDSILCGNNSRQNATQMLKEVWRLKQLMTTYRVLKDQGVYILITYGAPIYRLKLLKDSNKWGIKLHVIEKHMVEEKYENPIWELTKPVPLHDEGNPVEASLGNNPDVHYIYVCTKDESLKPKPNQEVAVH